ncbi:hypothetical protein F0U60_51735 [Archangium minus]|uniref:Uncharacterized protein n=1 Tax=Archangium minus TaxID=83450 RepID=A0ABY9X8E2_9BACT|nr:hypothetical protein F0U60_51735 [Archangium minus]
MRKPTWLDLGIAVLGLFLVCSAAQGVAQTQSTRTGAQSPSSEDTSIGDVTQDSRITGTSDAMGSGSGLVTNDTPQETGTGGAGTAGAGTGGTGTTVGTGTGQTAGTGGSGTGTQGTAVDAAQQRLEVARLRTEVARLEQQLAQMRARLSQAETASQGTGGSGAGTGGSGAGTGGSGSAGTGGSGSAGIGDPSAEGPEVNTGVGDPAAESVGGAGRAQAATQPDTSNQGYAVAHVIHTGRVRSVSQQRLVLVDEGGIVKTLTLAPNVRVVRGGRQVALQSLTEGAVVRASGDMYARDNPVFEIQVVPTAPAR